MCKNLFLPALAGILFFNTLPVHSQTLLNAGDIAFTGYNSDDNTVNGGTLNDDFSFILLRAIDPGTEIYFTDFGWRSDNNTFQSANSCGPSTGALSDGAIRWSTSVGMSYGAQVFIRCRVTPSASSGTVTTVQATFNVSSEYLSLATGGDHVFAFQGSLAAPILIAAINMNGGWEAIVNCNTFSSSQSALPPALSTNNYTLVITPEIDNARLKSTVVLTGVAATDRAAIHTSANWDVNDGTAFQLPAPGVGLPVHFVSFSLSQNKLTWQVADEYQLDGYRVERSMNGTSWEEIANVPASGSSSYSYTDPQPANGRNYYRIRSVDLDGAFQFSPVVSTNAGHSNWQLHVLGNPVSAYADIKIDVPALSQVGLRLMDVNGKMVWQKQASYTAGSHIIRIHEIKKWPGGIYFLQMQSREKGVSKFIRIVKN